VQCTSSKLQSTLSQLIATSYFIGIAGRNGLKSRRCDVSALVKRYCYKCNAMDHGRFLITSVAPACGSFCGPTCRVWTWVGAKIGYVQSERWRLCRYCEATSCLVQITSSLEDDLKAATTRPHGPLLLPGSTKRTHKRSALTSSGSRNQDRRQKSKNVSQQPLKHASGPAGGIEA
jgi:hypothetical protein